MKSSLTIRLFFVTLLVSLFGLSGLITPASVFAASSDLISVKTSPSTPGPNQNVTISIESFAISINSAHIVWYVNKEPRKEGIAEKSFTFQLGDFGDVSTVDIIIRTPDGIEAKKQLILAPAEIDILWEAQTYTPPFYKGKALPSYKSLLKVSAIPRYNSPSSNPLQFHYKWTYNRIDNVGEGLAKNSVVVPIGWADSAVPIVVDIKLPSALWSGQTSSNIKGAEAKVVFYESAPLLGVQFNQALQGSVTATGNEFTIRAVPYFFSIDNLLNNELVYTWKIGGSNVASGPDPVNFVLTKSGKSAESYPVSLRIQSPKRILQEGAAGASISFPAEN